MGLCNEFMLSNLKKDLYDLIPLIAVTWDFDPQV